MPLRLYGAGTSSGTYDYFTEAIIGTAKSSRGDYTASEDDNVLVEGVTSDAGGLGYFGLAYYEENKTKLKLVPVALGGAPVYPTDSTVKNGLYVPLSRPEFIYINAKAASTPIVKDFIKFYLHNAPQLVKEIGYVPLQDEIYQLAYSRFVKGKQGSMFVNKSTVSINLVKLLQAEK